MSTTGGLPVSVLEGAIGTLLIGAFMNCMLFAIELTQLWRYIVLFPTDRFFIRALVVFMFLVDATATLNACAMVYLYTIRHWGDAAYLGEQNNTVEVYSISMAVSVLTMHAFLIFRYITLSKNYFVAFFLGCLAVTAFLGDALATMAVVKYTALADRDKLRTYAIIWLSAASGADVCIALSLIWELSRVQSTFRKTKSLIRRLMGMAFATGVVTATLALVTLFTYIAIPDANYCLMFGMNVGRVCTLTVLFNLCTRKSTQQDLISGTNSNAITGAGQSMPLESGFQFTAHGAASATAIGGINVTQVSVTHVDGKYDDASDEMTRYDLDRKDRGKELV